MAEGTEVDCHADADAVDWRGIRTVDSAGNITQQPISDPWAAPAHLAAPLSLPEQSSGVRWPSNWLGSDAIHIPQEARGWPIFGYPVSARLAHVLEAKGVQLLGDLHGLSFGELSQFRNCGRKTIQELALLVQAVQHGQPPPRPCARHTPPSRTTITGRFPIPASLHQLKVSDLRLSARLRHLLERRGISRLGELQGMTADEFTRLRNCGRRTKDELVRLIERAAAGEFDPGPVRFSPVIAGRFSVPLSLWQINVFDLPLSARLRHVLELRGVNRLNDLHAVALDEFMRLPNCGRRTKDELLVLIERAAAGEFDVGPEEFAPSRCLELLCALDTLLARVSSRDQRIVILRLGGDGNQPLTLEEIAARFKLTRERVRQVVTTTTVEFIRREGGPKLAHQLRGLAAACRDLVCPLTPGLLSLWLGQHGGAVRLSIAAYVRLLGGLDPEIPAWPEGEAPLGSPGALAENVATAMQEIVGSAAQGLSLKAALERLRSRPALQDLSATGFLAALGQSRNLRLDFAKPDCPVARLRRLRLVDAARAVLEVATEPLTPEEIVERAQALFGADLAGWEPRTMGNRLTSDQGFYLLGPRAYGLRKHFRLPEAIRRTVRTDFRRLLGDENRPISAAEVLSERKFRWTDATNAYELAQILREDKHLVDLGKFLFGLAAWGIEEREYVKDLIPRILTTAGHPLTSGQVLERLRRLRSVSPAGMSSHLRKHPLVREFGFGYFGLKSWGASFMQRVVADADLVERVIRRAEPPLSFGRLCEILEIPASGMLAEHVWHTISSLCSVILIPQERHPSTRVLHKSCSLDRALVATAMAMNRPLPAYELQWELNARFGPLFADTPGSEIMRRLGQCRRFLRDAGGAFFLDVHLERLELDQTSIGDACGEILTQSNRIVGCEDLLERLEAEGQVWADLSPDILAALLRGNPAFQEVGHNRFRAKPCSP